MFRSYLTAQQWAKFEQYELEQFEQLCWQPASLFYRCHLDLYSFFFCHLVSEVTWPIVTKLCHVFDDDPDL